MEDIPPETARQLLEECATLVILGAPRGSYFGMDLKAWNTEAEFRGLKMIPPGLHYVHYSSSDIDTGDTAPRIGFLYNFKPKEMLVRMWDKKTEELSDEVVSDETIARLRTNLYNLDKFLAPYPYEILAKWNSLSLHITDELVTKLTPENGCIRSALELESCKDEDRPKGENRSKLKITEVDSNEETNSEQKLESNEESIADENNKEASTSSTPDNINLIKRRSRTLTAEEKEEELLPNLKPKPGSSIRFSSFPEKVCPDDATPAEITKHHLDHSYVLDLIIKRHSRPIDIVGELEFAYVCFLIGHSLDSFEYWKKLVHLFCSCEEALKKYCNVYMHFISVLKVQLTEIPEEFLADIVMNENFIYVSLKKFFRTVYNADIQPKLKSAIEFFQQCLTEQFMWSFGNLAIEEDDELPVIVHL